MHVRKRAVNIVRTVMEFGVESVVKTCDIIQFENLMFSVIFQNT
jgi:hypothetical protein